MATHSFPLKRIHVIMISLLCIMTLVGFGTYRVFTSSAVSFKKAPNVLVSNMQKKLKRMDQQLKNNVPRVQSHVELLKTKTDAKSVSLLAGFRSAEDQLTKYIAQCEEGLTFITKAEESISRIEQTLTTLRKNRVQGKSDLDTAPELQLIVKQGSKDMELLELHSEYVVAMRSKFLKDLEQVRKDIETVLNQNIDTKKTFSQSMDRLISTNRGLRMDLLKSLNTTLSGSTTLSSLIDSLIKKNTPEKDRKKTNEKHESVPTPVSKEVMRGAVAFF